MKQTHFSFIDLDGTFVCSEKKRRAGHDYEIAGRNEAGLPAAFINQKQKILLRFLTENSVVVPVTGRPSASFGRLSLQFAHQKIVGFGSTILDAEDQPVEVWWQKNRLRHWSKTVEEVFEATLALAQPDSELYRIRLVEDFGAAIYVSVKAAKEPLAALLEKAQKSALLPPEFSLHWNETDAAFLPPSASKGAAVRYLQSQFCEPDALCIGYGDSLSDADFLSACDFAALPCGSQLARQAFVI